MLKASDRQRDILICLFLALIVVLIYWQVSTFKFVYYDDSAYVTERHHVMAGLTWEGFKWAISATEAGFWHPVTWLSLMLDRELFGYNPGGYHWTNVILHIINTLLLFLFLRKATAAPLRSAFVALLFAVHPLHVESVAWVAQRKDLLCTLFGFAALWAYVKYAFSPGLRRYALVTVFFVLGLMSKPMIVTFPFVMLLLDVWPLRRLDAGRVACGGDDTASAALHADRRPLAFLLLEKAPLVLLSIAASILVVMTEHKVQAFTNLEVLSVADRLANAVVSYTKYMGTMLWPANLSFLYLHPVALPVGQVAGALLLLAAMTAMVLFLFKRKPYLFTGWFWYAGTLVPVIGLIQVGPHALADRYTYVPLIGLFIVLTWGAADLARRCRLSRPLLWTAGAIAVAILSFLTWVQVGYWRNTVTLFEHALKIEPNNYIVLSNLGSFFIAQGEYDKGIGYIQKAINVKPGFGPLYANLGLAMHEKGDYEKAAQYFSKARDLGYHNEDSERLLEESRRRSANPPGQSPPSHLTAE
jgi:tetratricopeptide (TPR) repeat protein